MPEWGLIVAIQLNGLAAGTADFDAPHRVVLAFELDGGRGGGLGVFAGFGDGVGGGGELEFWQCHARGRGGGGCGNRGGLGLSTKMATRARVLEDMFDWTLRPTRTWRLLSMR